MSEADKKKQRFKVTIPKGTKSLVGPDDGGDVIAHIIAKDVMLPRVDKEEASGKAPKKEEKEKKKSSMLPWFIGGAVAIVLILGVVGGLIYFKGKETTKSSGNDSVV